MSTCSPVSMLMGRWQHGASRAELADSRQRRQLIQLYSYFRMEITHFRSCEFYIFHHPLSLWVSWIETHAEIPRIMQRSEEGSWFTDPLSGTHANHQRKTRILSSNYFFVCLERACFVVLLNTLLKTIYSAILQPQHARNTVSETENSTIFLEDQASKAPIGWTDRAHFL